MAIVHRDEPVSRRIRLRRAYEPPSTADGRRILVDRIWPRGLANAAARVDDWMKEVAPSNTLRRWFGHDPEKWEEFQRRYRQELADEPGRLAPLLAAAQAGPITLVYGARDERHNQAVVLKQLLDERLRSADQTDADAVGEASRESFPASDAPGWAIGRSREDDPTVFPRASADGEGIGVES